MAQLDVHERRGQGVTEGIVAPQLRDGQIAAHDLVRLEDDENFWPPYPLAPVVRQEVLEEHPAVADALDQLAPLLDNETMSELNWQVSGQELEADTVARQFLEEHDLIDAAK